MDMKVEILTEVNIGSGEVLSQFSDYIYDDGTVYYIDHDRLLEALLKKKNGEKMLDQFIMIVKNQAKKNVRQRLKLKNFLEEAGLDYKEYALRKIPVKDEIKEQIQLHVKSSGQPYIPGSSLKGAIRTALISFFFNLSKSTLKSYNPQRKSYKPKQKYFGQDIFGNYGEDVLKYLHVSDTMPFQVEALAIARFYKFDLKSRKMEIPTVKEVIAQGSVSTFRMKTNAKKDEVKDDFAFLQEKQEDALLKIINEYTLKNITTELEQLQKHKSDEIKDIEEFYDNLLQTVKEADWTREAFLRIGSGKTYYDNTVANAIIERLSKEDLQDLIRRTFKNADANFFPKTRTIIMQGFYKKVPGWIKISKV